MEHRLRVLREALEPVEREAALVFEGREDLEGVREGAALRGEGAEGPVRSDDRAGQGLVVCGEGTEDVAGVVHERAQRLLLAPQRAEYVAGVGGEWAEVAECIVQIEPAAIDGQARVLHPGLEGRARVLVEALEDLVDLGLVLDLGLGEVATLGDRVWSVTA